MSEFNINLIKISWKIYNEERSDEGYFFEVQYYEKLHEIHNDLPFLPERMKIDKVKNFEVSLHVIHINSKQTLHHGLVLKAVHRVIKLN